MPSGVAKQRRSLISLSEIDQIFNESAIKELADALKVQEGAYSRLAHNVRNDARFFIEAKGRLNIPKLRKEIARLYGFSSRAAGGGKVTLQLARAVDAIPNDVREWLARCSPEGRNIPTAAEILSPATRADAVDRLRLAVSFGGQEIEGRKRPTGKRSRSVEPLLRIPAYAKREDEQTDSGKQTSSKRKRRPRGEAERGFVQNLALTYTELTGKRTPDTASLRTPGPFAKFVRRCFELIGAPTGSVIRLINQRGDARRALAGGNIDYPKDFSAYLDERERSYADRWKRKRD
jgi:hypothetical protein